MQDRTGGWVYGVQVASWQTGAILEPGLTKIGWTRSSVETRVADMQARLGAGSGIRIVAVFAVEAACPRVARTVQVILRSGGRSVQTGAARERFAVTPHDAERLVRSVAAGEQDAATSPWEAEQPGTTERDRNSMRGPKPLVTTSRRHAALEAVRNAARTGGSRDDLAGGQRGAAAIALAVETGLTKAAALIIMAEWLPRGRGDALPCRDRPETSLRGRQAGSFAIRR